MWLPRLLLTVCVLVVGAGPAYAEAAAPSTTGRRWVPPVSGPLEVTRPFRPPAVRWGAGHRGVDLAARPRSSVRAAGAGRVSYAGRLAGRGVVVVVHGALRTTYEPVEPAVRAGDAVRPGDPLGRLVPGHDTARPARSVLHWGLRQGETYLDPLSLLGGRPVRLLPRWTGSVPASGGDRAAGRPLADESIDAARQAGESRAAGSPTSEPDPWRSGDHLVAATGLGLAAAGWVSSRRRWPRAGAAAGRPP